LTNFFISLKNLSATQTPAFQQQIRIIHYIYVQNVSSYTIYKKKSTIQMISPGPITSKREPFSSATFAGPLEKS